MPANQAHKNRIKALDETYGYGRALRDSGLLALVANQNPQMNPSGKAKFKGKPEVAPYAYVPGVQAFPDQAHLARLRASDPGLYSGGLYQLIQELNLPPTPVR